MSGNFCLILQVLWLPEHNEFNAYIQYVCDADCLQQFRPGSIVITSQVEKSRQNLSGKRTAFVGRPFGASQGVTTDCARLPGFVLQTAHTVGLTGGSEYSNMTRLDQ